MTAMITTTIVKGDLRVKVRSAGDVIGNIERVSGQGPTGPIAEHCDSENEGDNALKHSNQGGRQDTDQQILRAADVEVSSADGWDSSIESTLVQVSQLWLCAVYCSSHESRAAFRRIDGSGCIGIE